MNEQASYLPENTEGWRARASRDLTVIVPAYCGAYLPVAVASVLNGPAAQVLIASDGGNLETVQTARRLEAGNPERVSVVHSQKRWGSATNVNEAAAQVETPFFAKLDGNDVVLPGFLESAFPLIAARPSIAVIAGHGIPINADEVVRFEPGLLPRARRIQDLRVMSSADA